MKLLCLVFNAGFIGVALTSVVLAVGVASAIVFIKKQTSLSEFY